MKGSVESLNFFIVVCSFTNLFLFPKNYILRVKKCGSTKKYK